MVLEWLRSSILQDKLSEIGKIKTFEKEVNLNADRKRFWLESLKNVKDKIRNRSYPLNPQRFPKAFEFNDDFLIQ